MFIFLFLHCLFVFFSSQKEKVHSCPKFTEHRYVRSFSLYVVDLYGRYSQTVRKTLDVKTSVFMYTNERDAKKVIISNAADFTQIRITKNLYDPTIRSELHNISTSDAYERMPEKKEKSLFDL